MAVMIECFCHRKQSINNKKCPSCGQNLDKVKKSEKAQYWINFYLGKKLKWERITNEKGESKLSDAQDAMAKRSTQKREGTLEEILDLKRIGQDRMTLQELSDLYTGQDHVKEKPGYSTFRTRLGFFNKVYGNKQVSSITRSDLLEYQNQRKKEKAAHSTIDQEIGAIRKVINAGYLDKKISHDVYLTFKALPKTLKKNHDGLPENTKTETYTEEEVRAIFQALTERSKPIWIIMAENGMREGEVIRLQWDRVDLQQNALRLKPGDTKEKKAKEIPLWGESLQILQGLYEDGIQGRVFNVTKDQFIDDVKKAHEIAKIPYGRKAGKTAHTLRHTWITKNINLPQAIRRRVTGHSSPEMDQRYLHVELEDVRKALEQAANRGLHGDPLRRLEARLERIEKAINKILTISQIGS